MPNALHMYPSAALLLWLWGTGVVLQVIGLLVWWAYRHERAARSGRGRQYRALQQDSDDASDCASTARDRRTSDDVPELSTRRHSTATVESVKEAAQLDAKPARAGAEDDEDDDNDDNDGVHLFRWRQLARRSAIATLLVALVNVITTTIVLKLRTGSFVEEPYDWYSLENTGKRLFAATHTLPANIMDTCKFRDAMADYTEFQTLDAVVQRHAEWKKPRDDAKAQRTVVHVVPFDYDHVLELNPDQMIPIVEPLPTSWTASSSSGDGDRDAATVVTSGFVKARPVDKITLFPYLWHDLLGSYFDPRVESPLVNPGLAQLTRWIWSSA